MASVPLTKEETLKELLEMKKAYEKTVEKVREFHEEVQKTSELYQKTGKTLCELRDEYAKECGKLTREGDRVRTLERKYLDLVYKE